MFIPCIKKLGTLGTLAYSINCTLAPLDSINGYFLNSDYAPPVKIFYDYKEEQRS